MYDAWSVRLADADDGQIQTNERLDMTKKHFIALADTIREHNSCGAGPEEFSIAQLEVIAVFCKRQNPRFDRERWLGYIAGTNGKNGGKVKAVQS